MARGGGVTRSLLPPLDGTPCVFCKDARINPFMAKGTPDNCHKTAPCMHRVCGPCEKSELATPKACPACGARITASSLSAKAPTLLRLEKETSTRGRLSAEWNLSRADFASEREFNDYLELRETVLHGELAQEDSMRAERERNATRHRDAIARNKARVDEERSALEVFVEREVKVQDHMFSAARLDILEARKREKQRQREENEIRMGTRVRTSEAAAQANKRRKADAAAAAAPRVGPVRSGRIVVQARLGDSVAQPQPLIGLEAAEALMRQPRPWSHTAAAEVAGWRDEFAVRRSRQELEEGA